MCMCACAYARVCNGFTNKNAQAEKEPTIRGGSRDGSGQGGIQHSTG